MTTGTAGLAAAAPAEAGRRGGPGRSAGHRSARPGSGRKTPVPAAVDPVASIAVDVALPHLDRPYDYLVPESLASQAVPGCRVRVRFAGRLTGGYVLARRPASDHPGQLAYLQRVVSPEPVLGPDLAGLARDVADRYGGTLADVLRLAIPPRHARAETAIAAPASALDLPASGPQALQDRVAGRAGPAAAPDMPLPGSPAQEPEAAPAAADPAVTPRLDEPGPWADYPDGPAFLRALAAGRSPRAVWSAVPGGDWPAAVARAVAATARSGRGALIVLPDGRDLGLVDAAVSSLLGPGRHVCLAARLGPAERYRRWLCVARGAVRIVAGTRSAMFAPVHDLGLVVIWDDGDDLHAEPRAPYPHARDVLLLRAHRAGAAALLGGYARTAEAARLVATGWARSVSASRDLVRQRSPAVRPSGDDDELARDEAARTARIPGVALRTASAALASGPVLFQVPRRGYLAAVACQHCHARVRCGSCGGPVAVAGPRRPPQCAWCGSAAPASCPACGFRGLRAVITGASRTAEELGRALPGVPVLTSGGSTVLREVPGSAAVVIATPGAEPVAAGGYGCAVLLDGWAMLGRADLRAAEEALRRWMNAAALVRSGPVGGSVIVVAAAGLAPVQALLRWDPVTHAERELAERTELGFPPAVRIASLTGSADAVRDVLAHAPLPPGAQVFGPVPARPQRPSESAAGQPESMRFLVRVPRPAGLALAAALRDGMADRSARKDTRPVRLQLDPGELV